MESGRVISAEAAEVADNDGDTTKAKDMRAGRTVRQISVAPTWDLALLGRHLPAVGTGPRYIPKQMKDIG